MVIEDNSRGHFRVTVISGSELLCSYFIGPARCVQRDAHGNNIVVLSIHSCGMLCLIPNTETEVLAEAVRVRKPEQESLHT